MTILSQIVKSNVFANVLRNKGHSLFRDCLDNLFISEVAVSLGYVVMVKTADLQIAQHWAATTHPVVLQAGPLATDGKIIGLEGSSNVFRAAGTHSWVVKALLDNKVNFNVAKADGQTPLFYAIASEDFNTDAIVQLLLNHGVKVDHQDKTGKTALHLAAELMRPRKLALLLHHGADVNHLDAKGRNALHNLCVGEHLRSLASINHGTVEALVNAGIDLFHRDVYGKRPIDYLYAGQGAGQVTTLVEDAMRAQQPGSV